MSKHAAIIFLGIFVVVLSIAGLPGWLRTALLIVSGTGIIILAYLSSVVYCSNCKKLINDTEELLESGDVIAKEENETTKTS